MIFLFFRQKVFQLSSKIDMMGDDGIIDLTIDSEMNADDEITTSELTQLTQRTLVELRESLINECNETCPILQKKIARDKFVLDHQHKTSKEEIGSNGGAGLCRGVMEFRCNALEGKIANNFKRLGLNKEIELPSLLRNLADYLERPNLPYIHPKEKPKQAKLMKSSYNKLVKSLQEIKYSKPIPEYPKSKKLTKKLEKLYQLVDLEPVLK